jgi:hypothetical protein
MEASINTLEKVKTELSTRVEELRPLVEEFHRIEGALRALGEDVAPAASAPKRRGRPPGSGRKAA